MKNKIEVIEYSEYIEIHLNDFKKCLTIHLNNNDYQIINCYLYGFIQLINTPNLNLLHLQSIIENCNDKFSNKINVNAVSMEIMKEYSNDLCMKLNYQLEHEERIHNYGY